LTYIKIRNDRGATLAANGISAMKTILVPAGGGASDDGVFETALAAARPLGAHLDFYHIRVAAGEAATNAPHAGFAMGAALHSTLNQIYADADVRLNAARDHVEQFCRKRGIPMVEQPHACRDVSACWSEESGESMPLMIRRARHSELVVLGRRRTHNLLPADLLERLLLRSGRPILVAPPVAAQTLVGTVLVCWKECAEAAHAVTAAMPLLRHAARVVVAGVSEDGDSDARAAVEGLARNMHWQGIKAEPQCVAPDGRPVATVLRATAQELQADLVVMGGYSHSRIREIIFGGCTDAFLRAADCAVLLVH
jgi:nucleotide-binding universal stress UspA family protein